MEAAGQAPFLSLDRGGVLFFFGFADQTTLTPLIESKGSESFENHEGSRHHTRVQVSFEDGAKCLVLVYAPLEAR
jgi:hypothetical protein